MTDDEFLYPDCLAAKLDDIEAEARGTFKDAGRVLGVEHLSVVDLRDDPAYRAASDADKDRILDAIHTIEIVAQVRARLAYGDLGGAKRFLGYLGADFSATIGK